MLSIFDDKKAINFKGNKFVISDNVGKLHIRNMIKPANILYQQIGTRICNCLVSIANLLAHVRRSYSNFCR